MNALLLSTYEVLHLAPFAGQHLAEVHVILQFDRILLLASLHQILMLQI
ncbi:unnamed protein product, partial [Strongylus vulgaris]